MTEKGKTIALIGSGAMGEAAIVGLLTKEFTAPENIHASDPVTARLTDLHQRYGITPYSDNNSAVQEADLVLRPPFGRFIDVLEFDSRRDCVAAGVAAGFALFVVDRVADEFGEAGSLPVVLAAWAPTVAGLLLALALLLHLEDG